MEAADGSSQIPDETRARLRGLAQAALEATATGRALPRAPAEGILGERRAVFVSLHGPGHALRGCIGNVRPVLPLGEAVVEMAAAAASRDPRFGPVRPEELDELTVELSVLTPFEEAEGVEAVTPGQHGLMIRGRGCSGLLLPQVAVELGWGAEEFLDATCRKAGLPKGAWRDPDVRVERFRAEVF